MPRLNVAMAYHAGDLQLAKNLLQWIADQNKTPLPFALQLYGDGALTRDQRIEMREIGKEAFKTVRSYPVHVDASMQKWPTGPNLMFQQALRVSSETLRDSFLWMEPDCVTLHYGWLDGLDEAYYSQPDRYFGVFSRRGAGPASLPDKWMSGVGIYPANAFAELAAYCGSEKPFDVASADSLVPRMAETSLIAHFWGAKDLPPTFVHGQPSGPNAMNMAMIPPGSAIFHRCKDGSLMRVMSSPPPPPAMSDEQADLNPIRQQGMPPPLPPKVGVVAPSEKSAFGGGMTKVMRTTTDTAAPLRAE